MARPSGSRGVALGARALQRAPWVQAKHPRHEGQADQLPAFVVAAAERCGIHRHDAARAPGEQPVEHLGHVAAHGLPHEQGRLHPFRIHNDAEPPGQIFQREVQRKRTRRPMGRRVPHQAVCATLEICDLRREQTTIRRKPRQEHHPRPRRIRTLAHLVDDGSPPCIIALLDHAASSLRPCRPGHLARPCRSRPSCPTLPRPTAPVARPARPCRARDAFPVRHVHSIRAHSTAAGRRALPSP